MADVNDKARKLLLLKMQEIIEANTGSLKEINLCDFTEQPDEGIKLIDSIAKNAKINLIELLAIQYNSELFKKTEFTDAFCLLLGKQATLEFLDLSGNDMDESATTKVLNSIKDSEFREKIKYLILQACNWYEDSACEALADFIAKAPSLESVDLKDQIGSRPIKVYVNKSSVEVWR